MTPIISQNSSPKNPHTILNHKKRYSIATSFPNPFAPHLSSIDAAVVLGLKDLLRPTPRRMRRPLIAENQNRRLSRLCLSALDLNLTRSL